MRVIDFIRMELNADWTSRSRHLERVCDAVRFNYGVKCDWRFINESGGKTYYSTTYAIYFIDTTGEVECEVWNYVCH